MNDKKSYHFSDLRAELLHVGELIETRPGHVEVQGAIRAEGQNDGSSILPIVAYNAMALAMTTKMRVGHTYGFNGYFTGDRNTHDPRMKLQVCWTDRTDQAPLEN